MTKYFENFFLAYTDNIFNNLNLPCFCTAQFDIQEIILTFKNKETRKQAKNSAKITNPHILRRLLTFRPNLLERHTIDNRGYIHTREIQSNLTRGFISWGLHHSIPLFASTLRFVLQYMKQNPIPLGTRRPIALSVSRSTS